MFFELSALRAGLLIVLATDPHRLTRTVNGLLLQKWKSLCFEVNKSILVREDVTQKNSTFLYEKAHAAD
jgi:hypothetical protein